MAEKITNQAFWAAVRGERLSTTQMQALVDADVYHYSMDGAVAAGQNSIGLPDYTDDQGGFIRASIVRIGARK